MTRSNSIGHQAVIRLFVSLGLLVALIAASSVGIYQAALHKAAHERAEELANFYTARLDQLEREWEIRSREFKVRIETTRVLEDPATATVNLQAFMTIQGADRTFQYLLIQTEDGKKLFDFGKDISLPSIPASAEEGLGHYLDEQSGQIYRVFEHPIWLGEGRGMGRFAAFFRIDNALLRQLSTPGLTLSLLHDGEPLASSGGQLGIDHLHRSRGAAEVGKEIRELPWTGKADDPIRIYIEAPVTPLFSIVELSMGMSLVPVVTGLLLWLTIGLWLMRQTRRVTQLGRAVGEYASAQQTTKAMSTTLASARQGRMDEITEVANAMEVMVAAIDKREREQKESTERLRESEQRFRQLFNCSSDAIFVAEVLPDGRQGHLIEVNDIACRRLGYTRDELLRMTPDDIDAPEHGHANDPEFLRKLRENQQATIERIHVTKDGRYIPVEINVHLFTLAGKDAILGVARDISERRQAEAALQDSETRFRQLFESMRSGAAVYTAVDDGTDFIFTDINASVEKIDGVRRGQLIGKRVTEAFPGIREMGLLDVFWRVWKTGQPEHFPVTLYRDNRIAGWRENFVYRLPSNEVVAIYDDVTELKRAETELRIAAVAFETQEAIMITDADSNITRVNQAFQRITGYSHEEVVGKNLSIINSESHDDDSCIEKLKQSVHDGSWSGEIWDRRKNGEIYPKWLTITAVKNEHGETTEYVSIFSDITARKQAEEEIRSLAFYDALTKLPNRRLLLDRFRLALSMSSRTNHYGAVLFLDMDRFKTLNDTLGHDYGDMLLIEVAQRIQACVRDVDTVARFGGDEFVVLIEEISGSVEDTSKKIALIAEKIRASLSIPYQLKEHECHSSPSIGVCLYRGNEESVDTLLKHADMAMYQAKGSGRNAVRFFDPAIQHVVEAHAAIESE